MIERRFAQSDEEQQQQQSMAASCGAGANSRHKQTCGVMRRRRDEESPAAATIRRLISRQVSNCSQGECDCRRQQEVRSLTSSCFEALFSRAPGADLKQKFELIVFDDRMAEEFQSHLLTSEKLPHGSTSDTIQHQQAINDQFLDLIRQSHVSMPIVHYHNLNLTVNHFVFASEMPLQTLAITNCNDLDLFCLLSSLKSSKDNRSVYSLRNLILLDNRFKHQQLEITNYSSVAPKSDQEPEISRPKTCLSLCLFLASQNIIFPSLQLVALNRVDLCDKCITWLIKACPSLTDLHLNYCSRRVATLRNSNSSANQADYTSFFELLMPLHEKLVSISIFSPSEFINECKENFELLKNFTSLQWLDLGHQECLLESSLTLDTLSAICSNAQNLRFLNLSNRVYIQAREFEANVLSVAPSLQTIGFNGTIAPKYFAKRPQINNIYGVPISISGDANLEQIVIGMNIFGQLHPELLINSFYKLPMLLVGSSKLNIGSNGELLDLSSILSICLGIIESQTTSDHLLLAVLNCLNVLFYNLRRGPSSSFILQTDAAGISPLQLYLRPSFIIRIVESLIMLQDSMISSSKPQNTSLSNEILCHSTNIITSILTNSTAWPSHSKRLEMFSKCIGFIRHRFQHKNDPGSHDTIMMESRVILANCLALCSLILDGDSKEKELPLEDVDVIGELLKKELCYQFAGNLMNSGEGIATNDADFDSPPPPPQNLLFDYNNSASEDLQPNDTENNSVNSMGSTNSLIYYDVSSSNRRCACIILQSLLQITEAVSFQNVAVANHLCLRYNILKLFERYFPYFDSKLLCITSLKIILNLIQWAEIRHQLISSTLLLHLYRLRCTSCSVSFYVKLILAMIIHDGPQFWPVHSNSQTESSRFSYYDMLRGFSKSIENQNFSSFALQMPPAFIFKLLEQSITSDKPCIKLWAALVIRFLCSESPYADKYMRQLLFEYKKILVTLQQIFHDSFEDDSERNLKALASDILKKFFIYPYRNYT